MKARGCRLHDWCPPTCEVRMNDKIIAHLNGDPDPMPRWWWVLCLCGACLAGYLVVVFLVPNP